MPLVVTSKAFRYRVYPTTSQVARFGQWEARLKLFGDVH